MTCLSTEPDLPFKGARTYLHGTDLVPAAVEALGAMRDPSDARLQVAFHGFARTACRFNLFPDPSDTRRPDDAIAQVVATWPDKAKMIGWFVETGKPVLRRISFDEDAIAARATMRGEAISIAAPPDNTAIELTVAMTKRLHYRLFPINEGRWVFSRLDLLRPLSEGDRKGLCIALSHRLGNRLTRSAVLSHGQGIGDIYFSVGHP